MESCKRFVVTALCALLLSALAADLATAQQCNVNALSPCLSAAEGAYPPRPDAQCCRAVNAANPSCLCAQFQRGNFPQSWIKNALAMPRMCGKTSLRGYRCGKYTIE